MLFVAAVFVAVIACAGQLIAMARWSEAKSASSICDIRELEGRISGLAGTWDVRYRYKYVFLRGRYFAVKAHVRPEELIASLKGQGGLPQVQASPSSGAGTILRDLPFVAPGEFSSSPDNVAFAWQGASGRPGVEGWIDPKSGILIAGVYDWGP